MSKSLIKIAALVAVFAFATSTAAQNKDDFNPIQTGVNSLGIAPDARGASMGDLGAATEPDANSQFWNPSKYAFAYSKGAVSINYTPWLRKLVNDIFLADVSGYWKLGSEDNQAISASLRYFSLGEVNSYDNGGVAGQSLNPYEMSFDVGYSRKLSEKFSMGVVFRYIYSDLGFSDSYAGDQQSGASAFSADISGYYTTYPIIGRNECQWSWGWNISNIGTKVSYTDGEMEYLKALEDWENMSPITGIFKSFSDAPGGFKEELKEITYSLGAEYSYNQQFFLRAGYFYQNESKGNLQYFGIGAGFALNVVRLDASYMLATAQTSPLDQTLRFTLTFDMDGLKDIFGRR